LLYLRLGQIGLGFLGCWLLIADCWLCGGWLGIACPGEGVHAVPSALSTSFQECELFALAE
jgi:hypothetical protein